MSLDLGEFNGKVLSGMGMEYGAALFFFEDGTMLRVEPDTESPKLDEELGIFGDTQYTGDIRVIKDTYERTVEVTIPAPMNKSVVAAKEASKRETKPKVSAFTRLEESLNATNVLSKEYRSTVLGWAMKMAEEARERGRKEGQNEG